MAVMDALDRGRESYSKRAWGDAHRLLSDADRADPLGPDDLELLAMSAYMLGLEEEHAHTLERAHRAHAAAGETARAVRCAFWLVMTLAFRGEIAQASGWLGRARRLVERLDEESVEHGYMLVPVMSQQEGAGEYDAALSTAAAAAEIAERCDDADLLTIALHQQGRALVRLGRVATGLGLLDEAMLAVLSGELSPIVTGLMYCSVIDGCQEAYAARRAREWTAALTRWCGEQPDLVSFTGRCLVHRAEIMQMHGEWPGALEEARRARERFESTSRPDAAGEALYRQGELHRLRGEVEEAEGAYREASRCGCEPQPGLALLRLAQGRTDAAVAAIRRVAGETTAPVLRARLLPAYVEIMLAAGDNADARAAALELADIAGGYEPGVLDALVGQATGAVALAEGDAQEALTLLRRSWQLWQELDVPYEGARVRMLVGLACRELGDEDAAALELEAARAVFAELGAAPALARVEGLTGSRGAGHGLTPRELEVLRLVASGETNKAIAAELVLSERTVDRHVSNILAKLRLPSRAAATAYAYEHHLV